ncbi:Fc.00g045020.m01.CDS01 [Cosmosporella sp. VM-42]
MANSTESSQFLLEPLIRGETASLASGGSHGYGNELPAKLTGLLIRDAAKKDVDGSPSQRQGYANNIFLAWGLELTLLLVATGLLGSIVAVLSAYSGHEVPNWNGDNNGTGGTGITLNALVAIIATIFRAILAFVALGVPAQLKWDWVAAKFRPMGDVQRFDDASRGAWGSLLLLPLVALRQPLAVIAVVVVVASLAIGPVTQQTMQTQPHRQHSLLPRALGGICPPRRPAGGHARRRRQSSNDSNIAALFTCPSGNCTFDAYADRPGQPVDERVSNASLGMCSRCEDVSGPVDVKLVLPKPKNDQVTFGLLVSTAELDSNKTQRLEIISGDASNGGKYLTASITGNLGWARKAVPRDFINTARWSAANFSLLAFSQQNCHNLTNGNLSCPRVGSLDSDSWAWAEPTGFVAATCILYPCVKHYAGIVRDGDLSEIVVRTIPLRLQTPEALWNGDQALFVVNWRGVQTSCSVNGIRYTSLNMSTASEKLLSEARETVLVHSKDWAVEDLDVLAGYTNVTALRECVATLDPEFISAFQREVGGTFSAVNGDALENRTCLYVAWAWFALPSALLLLCAVLISWVIMKDLLAKKGSMVWKNSVLPLLLKDYVPAIEKMNLKEVNAAAKELEVRLKKQE